jgi:opacity protein-like surface antigen
VIRKFALLLSFILLNLLAAAQDAVKAQKRSVHYVGVQANQLTRQLFNFGGSSSSINNPYLITYAVNSVRSGWGLNYGLGYTHIELRNEDPFNPLETTINDFFVRLGVERKVPIGVKWITSYGLDILRESEKNITESRNSQSGNFKTETRNRGTGIGLRFTLNYNISEKILLGTEATYYYKSMKETRKGTSVPEETEKFKEFTFTVPVALFLILKL